MTKKILLLSVLGVLLSCSVAKGQTSADNNDLESFLTANNSYLKIPLSKMASGHLHLNVVLNGVKGEFILDTGAGTTLVDPKHKDKYKLQTRQTARKAAGAGGETNLQQSINNRLEIGALTKQDFSIYTMSLDHVNTALSSMGLNPVDGIIGADILTANKGIIDYSNLILYLKK